jgi:succinate dehydrogenase / fumarate reductase cytochrome b subunit
MSGLTKTFSSSVGSKTLMALSGLGLVGFVIAHMLGNLQVFAGPEKLNAYAKTLKDLGPLLWVARIGLLGLFALHIGTAYRLVQANKAARPTPYVRKVEERTTFAARTMWWSGLIVLLFLLYHLAHFTLHITNPEFGAENFVFADGSHDVYRMVVEGFSVWWVSAFYIAANLVLGVHISHGAQSAFQTLGVQYAPLAFLKNGFGPALGALIVIGNCSMPLAVLLGLVGKGA